LNFILKLVVGLLQIILRSLLLCDVPIDFKNLFFAVGPAPDLKSRKDNDLDAFFREVTNLSFPVTALAKYDFKLRPRRGV
jgi:hypothetical protein